MSARGFEYEPKTELVDVTPVPAVPTPEEVALYGYMWRVRRFEQRSVVTNDPQLSPEAQAAFYGTGDLESCAVVASGVLSMDARYEPGIDIGSAASEITRQALSDPSYLAAVDGWAQCLQAFGYEVEARPTNASVAELLPGGIESAGAIQMAVRDYACQATVGLNTTLAELMSIGTKHWLEANSAVVDEYRRLQAELIDRAQAVAG